MYLRRAASPYSFNVFAVYLPHAVLGKLAGQVVRNISEARVAGRGGGEVRVESIVVFSFLNAFLQQSALPKTKKKKTTHFGHWRNAGVGLRYRISSRPEPFRLEEGSERKR